MKAHIVNLLSPEGKELLAGKRNAALEEGARVVDAFASIHSNSNFIAMFEQLAAAIRALKHKPNKD